MQALITALHESTLDMDAMGKLFDKLASKKIKTIHMDATGVMGGGTGGFKVFKRGRLGKPRTWRGSGSKGSSTRVSLSIVPLDDQKRPIKMRSGYKLWKSEYEDGSVNVSASIGDMGLMLKGLKA
jgi:hypothetical protein